MVRGPAVEVNRRPGVVWYWTLVLVLVLDNALDMLLLRMYTAPGSHETFPLLAHTLRNWGLDASIWTIRALLYGFLFGTMVLKRAVPRSLPYVNDLLIATNLLYFAGMCDEPFFTGLLREGLAR